MRICGHQYLIFLEIGLLPDDLDAVAERPDGRAENAIGLTDYLACLSWLLRKELDAAESLFVRLNLLLE